MDYKGAVRVYKPELERPIRATLVMLRPSINISINISVPSTVVGSWPSGQLYDRNTLPANALNKMSCSGMQPSPMSLRSPVSPGCGYLQKRRR